MKKTKIDHYTDKEALDFHNSNKSGKIEIISSKPMITKRDLALAYSPGVAAPVRAISKNPDAAYDYTTKGNLVAVISNGSAVLGMGNLGALASKPVMEGKAVLFKRFADINAIDIEIDSSDPNEIIKSIKNIAGSFGGINLEDIAAPDCFIIEEKLKEILDIPVFHDDQHGTAIITNAALINALDISKKSIKKIKVVVNGAGASAIACTNLLKNTGVPQKNIIMLDSKGVLYRGRDNLNQWKSAHAIETKKRTLDEAIDGADVFLGLSSKSILSKNMVKKMAKNPIIFACANPDPEITPEEVNEVRDDVIMATGRSDYPNQVNNLIGFPYIFRGALDVRAKEINEESLNNIGYRIDKKNKKTILEDTAPDYIYVGKNYVSNKFYDDIKIIVDYEGWIQNSDQKNIFPLILFSDFINNNLFLNEELNFIYLKTNDVYKLLTCKIPKNIVFILESNNDHFMADMRSFFFSMKKIKNPVVISGNYNNNNFEKNIIYSSTDLGGLFIQGYGDGIFIRSNKYNFDINKRINTLSFKILQAARVRVTTTDFISCPSCGRTLFDLTETTAKIREKTDHLKGLKIGIMGCIVNGPGEMADADYGYVGSGKEKITLYKGKEVVKRSVHYRDGVDELIKLIKNDGNWIDP